MLVLSRKTGERIRIGDGIAITVVELRGDGVRLGITAPAATPVHREEVFLRIAAEQRPAEPDMTACPPEESPYFAEFA